MYTQTHASYKNPHDDPRFGTGTRKQRGTHPWAFGLLVGSCDRGIVRGG